MPRSLDGAPERQPLLELQHDSGPATAVAADAQQQPAAGPPPESASAAPEPAAGAAPEPPAAAAVDRQLSEKRCRYCLQGEEDDGQLEAPCKCAGSIKWAHHDCVQRWVDEKHDKRCEICGSQFQGDYREPPPQPSLRHPLVAQLQVTNDDTRIVSLADPVTGQIVARMVMGPGAELRGHAAAAVAAGFERFRAGATAAGTGAASDDAVGLRACLMLTLVGLAFLGILATIPIAMATGADEQMHVVRLALICMLLFARAASLSGLQQEQEQRPRQAFIQRARRLAADLETGLPPQRRHAPA